MDLRDHRGRRDSQPLANAVQNQFRYNRCMLDWLFRKKKPPVSGISILLLQKRLERYSTERVNEAMQRAWRKEYDPETFFALSIFDGEGATVKALGAFFGILHFDRWLTSKELGDLQLPAWAVHAGYSSLEYACHGGTILRFLPSRLSFRIGAVLQFARWRGLWMGHVFGADQGVKIFGGD
jgi:hypothetical protein